MTPAQIKEARRKLGLTLSGMAALLSDPDGDAPPVDRQTIWRYEHGKLIVPSPVAVAVRLLLERPRN